MKLLDVFCGAGGAAVGYYRAGIEVVGVDISPQPEFPFEFIQADALEVLADEAFLALFDAYHASCPCQAYTQARHMGNRGRADNPRLLGRTRRRLRATGKPYVIENVEGARRWLVDPYRLCGSSFGLQVQRHRLFETNFALTVPPCDHDRWGTPQFPSTPHVNGSPRLARVVNPLSKDCAHFDLAAAMGIDWMAPTPSPRGRLAERGGRPTAALREAIPPVYTEWIGVQLQDLLSTAAAAVT